MMFPLASAPSQLRLWGTDSGEMCHAAQQRYAQSGNFLYQHVQVQSKQIDSYFGDTGCISWIRQSFRSNVALRQRCARVVQGLDFGFFGFFGSDTCCLQQDQEWGFLCSSRSRIEFGFYVCWKNVTGCLLNLYLSGVKQESVCLCHVGTGSGMDSVSKFAKQDWIRTQKIQSPHTSGAHAYISHNAGSSAFT